ncbi:MAG: phosphate ABC transporter permease subunit PstC [Hyphomicrobiales bacterium]|nr:phosphate ABC transporter permease subunit PstC [Hyphomicrobiales bacterium]
MAVADLSKTSSENDLLRGKGGLFARARREDAIFRTLTFVAAVTVLGILGGVFVSLIGGAMPALNKFGLAFFYVDDWDPVRENFGAVAPIAGTLLTAIIALIIAIPLGIGIAIFLTELCPPSLKRPIGTAVELLAGIPSIIYGIWGLFVFAPWFQQNLQPYIIGAFSSVPGFSTLFAGPPLGIGVFTAGIILAFMVLPFITAVTRDVFDTVPPVLKESAYGIGCTRWEVISNVVIPYTRVGVIGGCMLALGRALGETMAVTFVVGNAQRLSASLMAPGTTISATIANEFAEATGGLYQSAMIALGLLLFVLTFIVLACSRLLLARLEAKAGK